MKSGIRDTICTEIFILLLVIASLYDFGRSSWNSNSSRRTVDKSENRPLKSNISTVFPLICNEVILETLRDRISLLINYVSNTSRSNKNLLGKQDLWF